MNNVDGRIAQATDAVNSSQIAQPPLTPEEIRSLDFNAANFHAREHMFYRMMQETAAQLAETRVAVIRFNDYCERLFPHLVNKKQEEGKNGNQ